MMDAFLAGLPWEVKLMEWLQANLGGFGFALAKLFTAIGGEIIMVGIMAVIYFAINKKVGGKIITTATLSLTVGSIFKNILLRDRPYFTHKTIKCLDPVDKTADIYDVSAQGYSFPSLHSSNSVSAYASPYVFTKKKALLPVAILVPLFIGISRFVLGNHYPTDVMIGWLLGLLLIFLVDFLSRKTKKGTMCIILSLMALTGCFICNSNDYYTGLGILLGFLFGNLYEERHTDFKDTNNIIAKVLRILGAAAIFGILDVLFKLPFSDELLASATTTQYIIRFFRYGIIMFIIFGVYPMVFKYYEKIRLNKEKTKSN